MRYLGIDYGEKRIGIALSDENGEMAFPHLVVENKNNTKNALEKIKKICLEKKVNVVVFGESKNFDMVDNSIMKDIKIFAEELKKETGLKIFFQPEYMTSAQAEHTQGKNDKLDASAATIILQSYLDIIKNNK